MIFGAFSGYKEGFLMELITLAAILLGILGGFKLMGSAMMLLNERFNIDQAVLPYIAFGVVFLLVVLIVTLLGRTIKSSISKSFLGQVDQSAGAILGFFKTAFMLSVVLWLVHSLSVTLPDKWTKGSWIYPKVALLAPTITEWVSEYVPAFKDVF